MNPVLRETLLALSLLGLFVFANRDLSASETETPPAAPLDDGSVVIPPLPVVQSPARFVGSAGCSAVSCHGGRSLPGGELSHWAKFDTAHRRGFDVLHSTASAAMAQRLGIKAASEEARCLACHVAPNVHPAETRAERFAFEYGVGCESCHGPASEWVTVHTRPDWKSWSHEQKSATGYRHLKSLVTRSEMCVTCHVGSAAATVDHDLIAAGHPRLLFDMAAFHDQLPKHWPERAAVRNQPDQELKLWIIGHAASTRALSQIVASRAESAIRSGIGRTVPDLAEWDCHACHHDLANEPWRGDGRGVKSLGSATWGSWIIPSARVAARESQSLFRNDRTLVVPSLDRIQSLIQPSRFGAVNTAELLKAARQLNREADNWLLSLPGPRCDSQQCQNMLDRWLDEESAVDWFPTWDGQAQRYLAVLAVSQSLRELSGDSRSSFAGQPFQSFQDRLRYPAGYSTPHGFQPSEVQRLFRELRGK